MQNNQIDLSGFENPVIVQPGIDGWMRDLNTAAYLLVDTPAGEEERLVVMGNDINNGAYQDFAVFPGYTYELKYKLAFGGSGTMNLKVNEGAATIASDSKTTNGSYTLNFTPTASTVRVHYAGNVKFMLNYIQLEYLYTDTIVTVSSPVAGYRYGFQNQEKDDEIKGSGNSVNYTFRMHDTRLGRFFATDPLASQYSYNSPYTFSENIVIHGIELEGLEVFFTAKGAYLGMLGDNREIRIVSAENVQLAKKYIDYAKDSSPNGIKYQEYNTAVATSLGVEYHKADKTSQKNVTSSIYKIWVEKGIPLKAIEIDYNIGIAQTRDVGIFAVNPLSKFYKTEKYASDNLYDQIFSLVHEDLHSQLMNKENYGSGYGSAHFAVEKEAMEHWSYKYTTPESKSHTKMLLDSYLNEAFSQIITSSKGSDERERMVKQYNKDVEWFNETFDEKVSSFKE